MTLHYQIFGEGQPIVILHGLFGSSDNWRSLAQKFAVNGLQVITVDLTNHGRSKHTDEVSYESMAADVISVIRQLNLADIYLIGHSVGGKVAMTFSKFYPEYLAKLIVVDIAPKAYDDRHSDLFEALLALDLTNYTNRSQVSQALTSTIPDQGVRQFLLMNLESTNQQLSWKINLSSLAKHYENLLVPVCEQASVTIPTCFVRGGKSDYILEQDEPLIDNIFSNNSIITIPNVGHWVHAEAPEQFLSCVLEFINHD